jgi:acyl-CoA synthetase (AMP-forming)/AMP-acid ligase II
MNTVGELIERNGRNLAGHEAIVCADRRVTYHEYAERCRRLADSLYQHGVRRHDRVAVLAMNCIEYFDVYGACECAGFITTTVNFRLTRREINHILKDAAPKVLIFEAQYRDIVDALRLDLPGIDLLLCIGSSPEWAEDYAAFLTAGRVEGPPVRSGPDDLACLIYTSGTTGQPKGVIRTQRALLNTAEASAMAMEATCTSRMLQTTPVFHVGGKCMQLSALWMGSGLVLDRGFDPLRMLQTIESERINITFMVGPMLQAVLDHPQLEQFDLSTLRNIITAAAPIPIPLLKRAIARLGSIFSAQYGMTESLATAMPACRFDPNGTPDQLRRIASVGHALPRVDLKIVDENGRDSPTRTPGEVCLRSETQLAGYWNNSGATLEAIRDGWYRSGDIGYLDEEGYLFLVDRKKDMIISGGENIYSKEVEDALLEHPAVVDVAVIGVLDAKWGETVQAIVVCKPGTTLTGTELIAHCKGLIAGYKCPKSFQFTDELPRVASGKVNKPLLRERQQATKTTSSNAQETSQ